MDSTLYAELVDYLMQSTLPDTFCSTPSNFRRLAAKFEVNSLGNLLTQNDGKIVVQAHEKEQVWNEIHGHSGRDKTIAKFNQR